MNTTCSEFKTWIPAALLGELEESGVRELEAHLRDCAPCREEQALFVRTFHQVRSIGDVEVPRHFFIYPSETRPSLRQLMQILPMSWKVAAAASMLALGTLAILATADFRVRSEGGVLVVGFGPLPPIQPATPPVDVAAIKEELFRRLTAESTKENLALLAQLREEIENSKKALSDSQKALLRRTLSELENRIDGKIIQTAASVQDRTGETLAAYHRTLQLEREQDLLAINGRLNRIAASGYEKNRQTDEILETLLQVAELQWK